MKLFHSNLVIDYVGSKSKFKGGSERFGGLSGICLIIQLMRRVGYSNFKIIISQRRLSFKDENFDFFRKM